MHVLLVEWQHTADQLRELYRAEPDGTIKRRLHALWLLRDGTRTRDAVAHLVGAGPASVQRWLDWYRLGGLADLKAHPRGGHGVPRRLTAAQEAEITREAGTGQFRHIADVHAWVKQQWGVPYTYWGMRSVLDRLRIHAKVPRPQAPTANPARQEAWKKGA